MNAIFGFMMNFSTDQRGLKSISGCQVTMKTTRHRVASVHELGEPLWLQKPGRYEIEVLDHAWPAQDPPTRRP